jgi:hypothetical protein
MSGQGERLCLRPDNRTKGAASWIEEHRRPKSTVGVEESLRRGRTKESAKEESACNHEAMGFHEATRYSMVAFLGEAIRALIQIALHN